MDTLTATALSEILQEPERALLARALRQLGQERCAQVLAATLEVEAHGGMLLKDGSRRKSPGGVFFQLTKNACTGKERYYLFRHTPAKRPPASGKPSAPLRHGQAPPVPALAPMPLTLDLWKGLTPMPVNATLKLVLRDLPETREKDGMVYMALTNEPRGLPKNISLESGPLYLTAPARQWKTACAKAAEIRASGTPALLIVEAHVSTREGALIGVVKGVQVVEGKAAVSQAG
jgi:hypothetical protein